MGEAVLETISGIIGILIGILAIGYCIFLAVSCVCQCCYDLLPNTASTLHQQVSIRSPSVSTQPGDDLLPTIPDNAVNLPENPVGVSVTENPAAHRTQLQQDSIRSPSVSTQPPGNPNRVAHFNLTTPVEETTETTGVIITSGPPRYPYSAAELASWESPDISPPQDAPPPSYDHLFKS